jgi:hypothetical protein
VSYQFLDHPRLTLLFETPNQCGAVLGMAACLASGMFSQLHFLKPERRRWIGSILCLLILVLFSLIAITYSRGSYVAVISALLALIGINRIHRRRAAGLLVAFLLIVTLAPMGPHRIATFAMPAQDNSIANRFALWKGAAAMAWDNFPYGVGFTNFREQFTAWYQASDRFQLYTTGVSDYATIAACGGLLLLFFYLSILFAALFLGSRQIRAEGDPLIVGLIASLISYLVASASSTLILSPNISVVAGAILVVIASIACWRAFRLKTPLAPALLWSTIASVGAVLIVAAVGWAEAAKIPSKLQPLEPLGLQKQPRLVRIAPRGPAVRATVFLINDRWFPELDGRSVLRPMAAAGFDIVAFAPRDFGADGFAACAAILRKLADRASATRPLFLLGAGDGGRLALLLAENAIGDPLRGVVALSPSVWHPVPQLSPAAIIKRDNHLPFLLLHDSEDRTRDANASRRFVDTLTAAGGVAVFSVFKGGRNEPATYWVGLQAPLLSFFNRHIPHALDK